MLTSLFSTIRKILRGFTNLPHVGRHPGVGLMLSLVLIQAAIGGRSHGLSGSMLGGLLGLFVYGIIFAHGAYERSEYSDRATRREKIDEILRAWAKTIPDTKEFKDHYGKNPDYPLDIEILFLAKNEPSDANVRVRCDIWPLQFQVPEWIVQEINLILKDYRHGKTHRKPDARDLLARRFSLETPSAHERIAAYAYLENVRKASPLHPENAKAPGRGRGKSPDRPNEIAAS